MACYVDELFACLPTARWRYRKACHLTADTITELHEFAASLGLKRAWFQDHSRVPHYDLTPNKRTAAVQAGARSISVREMVARMMDPQREGE